MSALTARGSTRRWRRLRAYVLERDAFACRFLEDGRPCGRYATHVHHIDPRSAGGSDDPSKLAAACAEHNLAMGDRPGLELPPRRTPQPRRTDWSW